MLKDNLFRKVKSWLSHNGHVSKLLLISLIKERTSRILQSVQKRTWNTTFINKQGMLKWIYWCLKNWTIYTGWKLYSTGHSLHSFGKLFASLSVFHKLISISAIFEICRMQLKQCVGEIWHWIFTLGKNSKSIT